MWSKRPLNYDYYTGAGGDLSNREPLGGGLGEQRQRPLAHGGVGQRINEQLAVALGWVEERDPTPPGTRCTAHT